MPDSHLAATVVLDGILNGYLFPADHTGAFDSPRAHQFVPFGFSGGYPSPCPGPVVPPGVQYRRWHLIHRLFVQPLEYSTLQALHCFIATVPSPYSSRGRVVYVIPRARLGLHAKIKAYKVASCQPPRSPGLVRGCPACPGAWPGRPLLPGHLAALVPPGRPGHLVDRWLTIPVSKGIERAPIRPLRLVGAPYLVLPGRPGEHSSATWSPGRPGHLVLPGCLVGPAW